MDSCNGSVLTFLPVPRAGHAARIPANQSDQSRIASSYRAAAGAGEHRAKRRSFCLGNSLPLEGINIPQLDSALGDNTICVPFFVEQTEYLDWYYGMRRLLREAVGRMS